MAYKTVPVIVLALLCVLAVFPPPCAGAVPPRQLTQDDVRQLNGMEQEWAQEIDRAVLFIRQKNAASAGVHLKKAAAVLGRMKDLLVTKEFDVAGVDRLVAMELLTGAYANMGELTAFIAAPRSVAAHIEKIRALFADTRKKLLEAQMKFHQVPALQELCKNFRDSLDEFESEVRKVLAER